MGGPKRAPTLPMLEMVLDEMVENKVDIKKHFSDFDLLALFFSSCSVSSFKSVTTFLS